MYSTWIICLFGLFFHQVISQIYESGVSSDNQTIVDEHNKYRLMLAQGLVPGQPKATNMKRLVWDDSLARAAQDIANSLEFQHKRVSDARWQFVGQNLYMSMSSMATSGSNWVAAIKSWFDEYKQYTFGGGFSGDTGHYTQVAWADTTHVGCGYTFFKSSDGWYSYQKLYVCNYGPGGNYNDEAPYEINGGSECDNLC